MKRELETLLVLGVFFGSVLHRQAHGFLQVSELACCLGARRRRCKNSAAAAAVAVLTSPKKSSPICQR